MAVTLVRKSGPGSPHYLISSTTNLTIGSNVTVLVDGVNETCTVIKTMPGVRMYVVKKV